MNAAFLTGALAAAVVAAAMSALVLWLATIVLGSPDPWGFAPLVVAAAAALFGVATYLAERVAYRRTQARRRAKGEPWAFRRDG